MAEKTCTEAESEANRQQVIAAQTAHGSVRTDPCYGPAFVEVLEVNGADRMVTFTAPATGNTAPKKVTARWNRDDVFALCPSTLDCDEVRLPAKGATGTLYLNKKFIKINGLAVTAKWPNCFAGPTIEYRPLRIEPRSIKLTGVELKPGGGQIPREIELLAPQVVPPGQTIVNDGRPLTLKLSPHGTVHIQPRSIKLTGVELKTGTGHIERALELLAPQIVAPGQTIVNDRHPLTLELSQDGFAVMIAPWADLDALRHARTTIAIRDPELSARELARAWAEVAEWEELLSCECADAHDRSHHAEAAEIIKEIRRISRAALSG